MRILFFIGLALSVSTIVLPADVLPVDRYASPPRIKRTEICPGAPAPKPFQEIEEELHNRVVIFKAEAIDEQLRSVKGLYSEICSRIDALPMFAYDQKLQQYKGDIESWFTSELGMADDSIEEYLMQPKTHKRQRGTRSTGFQRPIL